MAPEVLRCQACDERSDGAAALHLSHVSAVLGVHVLGMHALCFLGVSALHWACNCLAGGLGRASWELLLCSICLFVLSRRADRT